MTTATLLLDRAKKVFTGPTWEEMGGAPRSTKQVPYYIDPPVPYKPGTEKAIGLFPDGVDKPKGRLFRFLFK